MTTKGPIASLFTLGIFLVTAFLPIAESSFTDSREWSAFAVSFTDADGVVAATSFSLNSAPHGFTVASRTTSVQWTAQLTTTPAAAGQIDQYTMTLIIKEGATTRVTCDGVSFSRLAIPDLGRFQSTFLSFCQSTGANALVPGTTYTYETTVSMVSGTNKIVQSGQSFKVQQTDSITDDTLDALATTAEVRARTAYTNNLVNQTKQSVLDRTTYTNALINSSFIIHEAIDHAKHAYQNSRANDTHAHIDSHFVYTNQLINNTVGSGLNQSIIDLLFRIDGNVSFIKTNLNNTFTMALGSGLDSSVNFTLLVIIAIIVLATWLYRKEEKNGIVYKAMGIIILLVAVLIALQLAGDWPPFGILAALIAFYGFGLAMHAFYQNKQRRKKSELEV